MPKELSRLDIREYRQTFFNAYRVIDRSAGKQAISYAIADGRRDMQSQRVGSSADDDPRQPVMNSIPGSQDLMNFLAIRRSR